MLITVTFKFTHSTNVYCAQYCPKHWGNSHEQMDKNGHCHSLYSSVCISGGLERGEVRELDNKTSK